MLRLVARFLLLVAVLAAPLGMTAAPAAPAHHAAMSSMPMQHCPEQQGSPEDQGGIADCAMACAAALPPAAANRPAPAAIYCTPSSANVANRLVGRHLEIATPPPKLS
jgi:hypothetical protein